MDLAWLKHHVSVGEDHGLCELVEAMHGLECAGIEAFRERILEEIAGGLEQARVVGLGAPQALECAEIIGVTELIS